MKKIKALLEITKENEKQKQKFCPDINAYCREDCKYFQGSRAMDISLTNDIKIIFNKARCLKDVRLEKRKKLLF